MIGKHLILRAVLMLIGLALLIFGALDLFLPHARFVSSNPSPAAIIADPPSAVIIKFNHRLASESSMDVTSTIRLRPSGEKDYLDGSSVVMKSGIDASDAGGKSMRADLRAGLHQGLYWVTWRTTAAGWRTVTYGKTYFGVGMTAPEGVTADLEGGIRERNYQWRSRRGAIVGGVVLIALGLLLSKSKE